MKYSILLIPLLFIIGIYFTKNKIKEPMVGTVVCEMRKMPYDSANPPLVGRDLFLGEKGPIRGREDRQVDIRNELMKQKIKAIRQCVDDKASWEHQKINTYLDNDYPTKNNWLEESPSVFYLKQDAMNQYEINPVLTQFESLEPNVDSIQKRYLEAPKNVYIFNSDDGFRTYL